MSKWLKWAQELQALAQAGLHYSPNIYDLERFERIREISFEMMGEMSDFSYEEIKQTFSHERGYQTPKIDTRGVVWRDDRLLLVQEKDGLWCLPGGWMDITETIASNTEKELLEEAGVRASASRVIAIHDRSTHNAGTYLFEIIKIFVECEFQSIAFQPNSETIRADFFAVDQLPLLSLEKTSRQQIDLCARAHQDPNFVVEFD